MKTIQLMAAGYENPKIEWIEENWCNDKVKSIHPTHISTSPVFNFTMAWVLELQFSTEKWSSYG